jgi:cardiolipin synthase
MGPPTGPDREASTSPAPRPAPRVASEPSASSSAIVTIPNALSLLRILAIPAVVALLVHHGTEAWGLALFGLVASTDWIDGYVARRTHRVSDLGKVLDPVADRLALASALVALVVRGIFPLWAMLAIVARDATVLLGGLVLATRGVRIDVRRIGKAATFALMLAVPAIAWGELGRSLAGPASAIGWTAFAIGIVLYYAAAVRYAVDARTALARGP